jgi:hypothetical protein
MRAVRQTGLVLLGLLLASFAVSASAQRRPPRPSLRRQVQVWPRLTLELPNRRLGTFGFDGHVHTHYSHDADHPPLDVLQLAAESGLDALVVTDHGASSITRDLPRYRGPLTVLVGEEVGGSFGHAVIWNVPGRRGIQEARRSMDDLAAHVHRVGGLVVLAHPAWWMANHVYDPRRWMDPQALRRGGIGQGIDALELWNGVYHHRSRELIDAWVDLLEQGVHVPIVGNSDFHTHGAHRLGRPRNVVLCRVDGEGRPAEPLGPCLLDAVRAGRLFVSDGPLVTVDVQGRTLGDVVEVRPGEPLRMQVRALAPDGGRLQVFVGRRLAATLDLAPRVEGIGSWTLEAPSQDSYVRVEIQRLAPQDGRPPFSLVSNPVRLDVAPRQTHWRGPDVGHLPPPPGYTRPGRVRFVRGVTVPPRRRAIRTASER